MTGILVGSRFTGPPGTANGGYFSGLMAAAAHSEGLTGPGQAVRVTLRLPPPVERRLQVESSGTAVTATQDGGVVAEAESAELSGAPVPPLPFAVAHGRMSAYAGFVGHPFPGCFVCGIDRPAPDGLGLRPGPVDDEAGLVTTAWVPDGSLAGDAGSVDPVFVWAALDCPGGWSAGLLGRPMVLGRMTARIDAVPEVGDRCVVMGRHVGSDGRKAFTLSTAYDGDGRLLGHAEAVWIEVDLPPLVDLSRR